MSIEQRLEQVERQTKRLRVAVVVLAAALCGVVSMAATESEVGRFETVFAKSIYVEDDKGAIKISLSAGDVGGEVITYGPSSNPSVILGQTVDGTGVVVSNTPSGNKLIVLGATVDNEGTVTTYTKSGKALVSLSSTENGGSVTTYGKSGKDLVKLSSTDNGGAAVVYNKTGEGIVSLLADDYGNGEVGAWNRKGEGRVWDSQ